MVNDMCTEEEMITHNSFYKDEYLGQLPCVFVIVFIFRKISEKEEAKC